MLPIFPLPPPEEEDIPFAELVPLDPPSVDIVPLLTIEGFRGVTAETCREVLDTFKGNDAAHIQEICAEFRAALSIREHYADYSFHPTLTTMAHELAAHMCAFGALPIPPERFPTVRVGSREEFHRICGIQCDMFYVRAPHAITVHAESVHNDGDFPPTFYEDLGEELGHFFRAEILREVGLPPLLPEGTCGWVRSCLVEEFYGYMGRRVLQEALRKHPLEQICFPSGTCETFADLQELRNIRKTIRKHHGRLSSQRKRHVGRKEILTHARGYRFAQMVDMGRIANWHAFFALPESDVRRRFFRKDQEYRGL